MFDFSHAVDLPLIWGLLIATAIFLYVLLDGFDLGIGILFPFAPSDKCRDRMMNSIAPFWDGNETWLVLGGGGVRCAVDSDSLGWSRSPGQCSRATSPVAAQVLAAHIVRDASRTARPMNGFCDQRQQQPPSSRAMSGYAVLPQL